MPKVWICNIIVLVWAAFCLGYSVGITGSFLGWKWRKKNAKSTAQETQASGPQEGS